MAISPESAKFDLPREADAIGPQNEAEKQVYELVMAGINGGPSKKISVAEWAAALRTRIHTKR